MLVTVRIGLAWPRPRGRLLSCARADETVAGAWEGQVAAAAGRALLRSALHLPGPRQRGRAEARVAAAAGRDLLAYALLCRGAQRT